MENNIRVFKLFYEVVLLPSITKNSPDLFIFVPRNFSKLFQTLKVDSAIIGAHSVLALVVVCWVNYDLAVAQSSAYWILLYCPLNIISWLNISEDIKKDIEWRKKKWQFNHVGLVFYYINIWKIARCTTGAENFITYYFVTYCAL